RACHRIGAVLARNLFGKLLAVGDVGDHQARAFGGQPVRIMPADPLGAAGEERDAAGEARHGYFFPLSRRMNFSKPASCCLTMSMVGWSVSSSVFSSNFLAANVTRIS